MYYARGRARIARRGEKKKRKKKERKKAGGRVEKREGRRGGRGEGRGGEYVCDVCGGHYEEPGVVARQRLSTPTYSHHPQPIPKTPL